MSKRVADLLVETLQAAGVKTCYGIVGDTMNRIAQAIHRSQIDWIYMRHEEAGAFAAADIRGNLDLLTSEQTLIGADAAVVDSDGALIQDQIAVFKALDGGWE